MPTKHKKMKHETETIEPVRSETVVEDTPESDVQIVEKIVYKKQRVHGFFRTLTIIVLLVVGFLLLGETMGIAKLTIGGFQLDIIYPIFIIFSTIVIWSYRDIFGKVFGLILFLGVFGGFFTIRTYNELDSSSPTNYGEPIAFSLTGDKPQDITIETLVGKIEMEGNTKSPFLQGTWTSDRNMLTEQISSGKKDTIVIKDNNTLDLLQDFTTKLIIYVPAQTTFNDIYIKNARGKETIDTQDLHRKKLTLHGGLNNINLTIHDVSPNAEIEIQGAIQNIVITIPKDIGVQLQYRQRIGIKSLPDIEYQTGHLYASTNIDTAKKIIKININTLIGKVKINRE